MWPRGAPLRWAANALEGLRVEFEPLFHPDYKTARETYGRRFEERTPRFIYVVLFVGVLQMFWDPQPAIRAFFVAHVAVLAAVLLALPRHVNTHCATAVALGILILVVRIRVMGAKFFTMGYDVKATLLGPITCFTLGARSGATLSVASYILIMLQSGSAAHTLSNARVVLIGSALGSLLSEAGRVREELVAARLRERTAEVREFEMRAVAARAEVAQAKAAQLVAEADKARAAKLRAEDQRRTMERLYHKALTQVKVPLVLARTEMQACESIENCPGCRAAEQRINELWQLLTTPTGTPAPRGAAPAPGAGGGAGAGAALAAAGADPLEGWSSPAQSAASSSSLSWSYDALQEFKEVAIAFDAERFILERVTVRFQEPGMECKRPMPRLDQWIVPEEWRRVECWMQGAINAILNDVPAPPYDAGPLCLRWPGGSFVKVQAARVAWLDEPLGAGWGAGGGEEQTGPLSEEVSGGSSGGGAEDEESYRDGHFALLLSELFVPVPARHEHRRRRRRHHQGFGAAHGRKPTTRAQGAHLDCVDEFYSVADDVEETAFPGIGH